MLNEGRAILAGRSYIKWPWVVLIDTAASWGLSAKMAAVGQNKMAAMTMGKMAVKAQAMMPATALQELIYSPP